MTESLQVDTTSVGPETRELDWIVNRFVDSVPGAAHAVLVSADGLLMAASGRLPADRAADAAAGPPPAGPGGGGLCRAGWPAWPPVPHASSRAVRSCRPSSRWRAASCC